MTLTVKSTVKTAGLSLIQGAQSGFSRFAAHSFDLGSGSNYTPVPDGTAVQGNVVYTGLSALIEAKVTANDTTTYSLTVPEGAGPFSFGSVILYANNLDGSRLAFLEASLPFAVQKIFSDPNLSVASPFPLPGSRLVITFTVTTIIGAGDTPINVTVSAPSYSSLAYFPDETTLPPPQTQPWNQFVLHNHSQSGAPALVTKRADDTYWGAGFLQNLTNPNFGTINGGYSGDGFLPDPTSFAWGGTYGMQDSDYAGQLGGFGYQTLDPYITQTLIGNRAYTDA